VSKFIRTNNRTFLIVAEYFLALVELVKYIHFKGIALGDIRMANIRFVKSRMCRYDWVNRLGGRASMINKMGRVWDLLWLKCCWTALCWSGWGGAIKCTSCKWSGLGGFGGGARTG